MAAACGNVKRFVSRGREDAGCGSAAAAAAACGNVKRVVSRGREDAGCGSAAATRTDKLMRLRLARSRLHCDNLPLACERFLRGRICQLLPGEGSVPKCVGCVILFFGAIFFSLNQRKKKTTREEVYGMAWRANLSSRRGTKHPPDAIFLGAFEFPLSAELAAGTAVLRRPVLWAAAEEEAGALAIVMNNSNTPCTDLEQFVTSRQRLFARPVQFAFGSSRIPLKNRRVYHADVVRALAADEQLFLGMLHIPAYKAFSIDAKDRRCFLVQNCTNEWDGADGAAGGEGDERGSRATSTESFFLRRRLLRVKFGVYLRTAAFARHVLPANITMCSGAASRVDTTVVLELVSVLNGLKPIPAVFGRVAAARRNAEAPAPHVLRLSQFQTPAPVAAGDGPGGPGDGQVRRMKVPLLPYQRADVDWMIDRENTSHTASSSWCWVPVREQRVWCDPGARAPATVRGIWYNPVLNAFALNRPPTAAGGILAEGIGTGKTVICIALAAATTKPAGGGGTLVICPVSIIQQWADEVRAKSCLSVYVYYGPRRKRDGAFLARFDVVVTSFGIVRTDEHRAAAWAAEGVPPLDEEVPPLRSIRWKRIVVDEAHTLNAGRTGQACCALSAEARWAVSGTPFPRKRPGDLYRILGFLRHESVMNARRVPSWMRYQQRIKCVYNNALRNNSRPHARTYSWNFFAVVRSLVRSSDVCTRAGLPEKTEVTTFVRLSAAEQRAYNTLVVQTIGSATGCARERRRREQLRATRSPVVLLTRYVEPLRRLASCPGAPAVTPRAAGAEAFCNVPICEEDRVVLAEDTCAICLQPFDKPCRTPCKHLFCFDCLDELCARARNAPACRCPLCRCPFAARAVGVLVFEPPGPARGASGAPFSSKFALFIESYRQNPDDKFLVFSQYSHTLAHLRQRLHEENVEYGIITGAMPGSRRARVLKAFATPRSNMRVFLLSMRSAAVGLNVTAANRVVLWEPCINAALKVQAVGRVWRMGQTRPVVVDQYLAESTVEQRIAAKAHDAARHALSLDVIHALLPEGSEPER